MKNSTQLPEVGTENQGYIITDVYRSNDTTVVIAYSQTAPSPWVCWLWDESRGFNYGRYYTRREDVTMFMARRITNADVTTIAAAEGAVIAAADRLGIMSTDDILDMMDYDLTTPGKAKELEKLAEHWRIR